MDHEINMEGASTTITFDVKYDPCVCDLVAATDRVVAIPCPVCNSLELDALADMHGDNQ